MIFEGGRTTTRPRRERSRPESVSHLGLTMPGSLRHFDDLTVLSRAEIADDGIGFIDFDASSSLKAFQFDIRIDIGVEIILAHGDIRRTVIIFGQKNGDTVRRGS